MHWGSSFFLLFLSLCFIFCMLPLRLEFNLQHQRMWSGRLVLHRCGCDSTGSFLPKPSRHLMSKTNQRAAGARARYHDRKETIRYNWA